jgi:phosphate transport system substrate-binding protein
MVLFSRSKRLASTISLVVLLGGLAACGGTTTTPNAESPAADATAEGAASDLSGDILADGSSTVYPITEAMAEEFMAANSGVRVTVGTSGTGGGFEKFCNGETVISNASRPIKEEELAKCAEKGVEVIELPVAIDALTVVVNPENDWATCLTTEELNKIWAPEAQGTVTNWNQIRPDFPDAPLALYGPGTDSGTFDYFTDTINGEEGASRGDYTASEDDNVLVTGVEGDKNAMAYFGYAYYAENEGRLKAVEVDSGSGCVAPNQEDVLNGTYEPLSRPLFVYVSKAAIEKPEVKAFVDFYLDTANKGFVEETGYVAMTDEAYAAAQDRLAKGETGSFVEK